MTEADAEPERRVRAAVLDAVRRGIIDTASAWDLAWQAGGDPAFVVAMGGVRATVGAALTFRLAKSLPSGGTR